MKKILVFVLSLTLVLSLAACRRQDGGTLVVGTSDFSGEFIFFGGSSSYDVAIRDLVNGAGTIAVTAEGQFVPNPTVLANADTLFDDVVEHANGDKTYRFELNQDLVWSDGEPITVDDYYFSLMMGSSYSMAQAGHTSLTGGRDLVGFQAVRDGETTDFAGFNRIDDYTYELTIDGSNLPYFYELNMVSLGAQPSHVYSNDGEYEWLTAAQHEALGANETHIGEYIRSFRSAPPVSSGSYVFETYEEGQFVRLTRNENFHGDYRGHVPEIDRIVVRVVPSATDIEHLLNEEIDILAGLVEGNKIERALAAPHIHGDWFPRVGFGALFFHTDFGPTQDYRVRQALAYLVDREGFVDVFLEGYGSMVNSPMGLGQWMVSESSRIPDELISYSVDTAKAAELLDDAGWAYDENGNAWDGSGYRHNSDGEVLRLNWLGTESEYSDLLAPIITPAFTDAGIQFTARQAGFDILLDHYYYAYEMDADEREYHMYNLASSFTALYDPYYSYHSDMLGTTSNANQFEDSIENPAAPLAAGERTVDELTVLMRNLDASETDQFVEYWEELQIRLNKLLPILPLYSNQYYHFVNTRVRVDGDTSVDGIGLTGFWNWQQAVVDLRIVED